MEFSRCRRVAGSQGSFKWVVQVRAFSPSATTAPAFITSTPTNSAISSAPGIRSTFGDPNKGKSDNRLQAASFDVVPEEKPVVLCLCLKSFEKTRSSINLVSSPPQHMSRNLLPSTAKSQETIFTAEVEHVLRLHSTSTVTRDGRCHQLQSRRKQILVEELANLPWKGCLMRRSATPPTPPSNPKRQARIR